MTLTEFLLARIAEDEEVARYAATRTRSLADVEAKRRIVEQAAFWVAEPVGRTLDYVARILALPYADHPDFQEEWRP